MILTKKELGLVQATKVILQEQQKHSDREVAHIKADDALCDLLKGLGLNEIAQEFESINKWYS